MAEGLLPATWDDLREEMKRLRRIEPSLLAVVPNPRIVCRAPVHRDCQRRRVTPRPRPDRTHQSRGEPLDTGDLAAVAKGTGDCKQHAILKYAALHDAGFSPDAVRIVIVGDKLLHQQHALVAVREEGRWLI